MPGLLGQCTVSLRITNLLYLVYDFPFSFQDRIFKNARNELNTNKISDTKSSCSGTKLATLVAVTLANGAISH